MYIKLIDFVGYSQLVSNGRSLGTTSPVQNISGPTTTLFYDLRGSATYTSCPSLAMGTLDRWRTGSNISAPLKRDQWVFWSTGTAELVRIMEQEKCQIPFHWTDKLPEGEIEYPDWTKNLVGIRLKEIDHTDSDQ